MHLELLKLQCSGSRAEHDHIICAGTLGIFLAAALAKQGKRVACVERGGLVGRDQEWNISREDMKVQFLPAASYIL